MIGNLAGLAQRQVMGAQRLGQLRPLELLLLSGQQAEGGAHAQAGAVAHVLDGLGRGIASTAHDHWHTPGRLLHTGFQQPLAFVRRHLAGLARSADGGQAMRARLDQVVDDPALTRLVDAPVRQERGVDDREDAMQWRGARAVTTA
jgi:hypothetical protein